MTDKHNTEEAGRYTQSKALREIVTWSSDRPSWQRDALKQLIAGVNIDDIDLDRLEALCAGERKDAAFLTETDVSPQGTSSEAVTISKLQSLRGVNALADEQQMKFLRVFKPRHHDCLR